MHPKTASPETERRKRTEVLAWQLIRTADKMREEWAESDKGVQNTLWTSLHTAADNLREELR